MNGAVIAPAYVAYRAATIIERHLWDVRIAEYSILYLREEL